MAPTSEADVREFVRTSVGEERSRLDLGAIRGEAKRRRQRRTFLSTAAGVTALAVAATFVVSLDRAPSASAATRFLLQQATTAASQPAVTATSGGSVMTGTIDRTLIQGSFLMPGSDYVTYQRSVFESWTSEDGTTHSFAYAPTPPFPDVALRDAWLRSERDGAPGYAPEINEGWSDAPATATRDLSGWPTDVEGISARLGSDPGKALEVGTDILCDPAAPPALRAAIFSALAREPGVQYVGPVVDSLGRSAEAIETSYEAGVREQYLFDSSTSAMLETRLVVAQPNALTPSATGYASGLPGGTVLSSSAVIGPSAVLTTERPWHGDVSVVAVADGTRAALSGGFTIPLAAWSGDGARLSPREATAIALSATVMTTAGAVSVAPAVANITRSGFNELPLSWLSYGSERVWLVTVADACVSLPSDRACGIAWHILVDDHTGQPVVGWADMSPTP